MISGKDLYNILSNIVPLYVVLILAYASVKWWKFYSPDDCSGINRYVAIFAVPLLSIKFISNNNPYVMNFRFIAADTLQKFIVIIVLYSWCKLSSKASIDWGITIFQLLVLPNALLFGIPLLGAMYGEDLAQSLMAQISVFQFNVWLPVLLFLLEYRRATRAFPEQETVMSAHNAGSLKNDYSGTLEHGDEEVKNVGVLPYGTFNSRNYDNNGPIVWPTGLSTMSKSSSTSKVDAQVEFDDEGEPKPANTLPKSGSCVTTKMILIMVCKKLMKNPNFYASLVALIWSLISFRWHVKMPAILANSIKIFSDTGLGMAIFSLGLFMASQPKIISGGIKLAALAAAMRFIVAPATTAAAASAIGLRGTLLQIIIMQASLPQAIMSFVFAREYNILPGVMSTAVSFGMLISLPVTLVYYIFLGLCIK